MLWIAAALMASCTQGLKVEVTNPTQTERDDETVEIEWSQIAALKGVSAGEMTRITQENGCRLFGIEA